ncbi:MAG: hypothetical protein BGN97_00240 [Microbacterium sp. 69-10]|mgnify:CR=1 FL=1|uniref:hypothetical protein n=1 Tax=Microbacterium sp. 69-10 TaxID=1895783 RepID=UPI00095B9692|nr:hypothetical protein [Microbacterium sp. 69-10]OJU39684.1 MAG: hypothetical protein BGN97_00240 [Microbacterium sp. 69-10]
MPDVEFADAEAMVGAFLRSRLGVPVSTKVPNPRPARFARAWRTGGGTDNRAVETVQITVTCSAADSVTASNDAAKAKHLLLNEYTAMPLVRGVTIQAGPYFDPDPDTNGDRYTVTAVMRVRARRDQAAAPAATTAAG